MDRQMQFPRKEEPFTGHDPPRCVRGPGFDRSRKQTSPIGDVLLTTGISRSEMRARHRTTVRSGTRCVPEKARSALVFPRFRDEKGNPARIQSRSEWAASAKTKRNRETSPADRPADSACAKMPVFAEQSLCPEPSDANGRFLQTDPDRGARPRTRTKTSRRTVTRWEQFLAPALINGPANCFH